MRPRWHVATILLTILLLSTCATQPPEEPGLTGLELSSTRVELAPGERATLEVTPVPGDAPMGELVWQSTDEDVATVVEEGTVEALAPGTAMITVTAESGVAATAEVVVSKPGVEEIGFSSNVLILQPGESATLSVTTQPSDASLGTLDWRTNNEEVVAVNAGGRITAVSPGTTQVSVRAEGESLSAQAIVVVPDRFIAGQAQFSMSLVPGRVGSKPEARWLSRTEVTAELWETVREWATTDAGSGRRADGGPLYEIPSAGRRGNDGDPAASTDHPVTRVSWRSAVIWLNALTEFINATTGTDLEPVYHISSSGADPLRKANRSELIRRDVLYSQDNPFVKNGADGFRLPTSEEWLRGGRYILDLDADEEVTSPGERYPEDFASGADASVSQEPSNDFDGDGSIENTEAVATYSDNSAGGTAPVGSRRPNHLGLYDVSGNVEEWVFDWHPERFGRERTVRGGSWDSAASGVQIDAFQPAPPYFEEGTTGFRVARNAIRIPLEALLISAPSERVEVGGTIQLQSELVPANGYHRGLQWESENPDIAVVSANGVVKGVSGGTTTIRLSTRDGEFSTSLQITVFVAVAGIEVDTLAVTLEAGESYEPTATVLPENATNRGLRWKSGNREVVEVSPEGMITAQAPGTVFVTVSTGSGAFSEQITVIVREDFALQNSSFSMVEVPEGRYPRGLNDDSEGDELPPFWIATRELTYSLWKEVLDWASASGQDYTITAVGRQGGYWPETVETTESHPVTEVSWDSAIVWANALTEYYNETGSVALRPVYFTDRGLTEPAKDDSRLEQLYIDRSADGFRIPNAEEWEKAARFRGTRTGQGAIEFPAETDRWWTPGNFASGASGSISDRDATREVAVVTSPPGSTAPVGSRKSNTLGIYDMSGNIEEWTLERVDRAVVPVRRGGSWFSDYSELRVSGRERVEPGNEENVQTAGIRLARNEARREIPEVSQRIVPPDYDLSLLEASPTPPPDNAEEANQENQAEQPPAESGEEAADRGASATDEETVTKGEEPTTRAGASAPYDVEEPSPPPAAGPGSVKVYELPFGTMELALAPATTFPAGPFDSRESTVGAPFRIGMREVTFELWRDVREWATAEGFVIPDAGSRHRLASEPGHPVSHVSWWSAVIWANALTAYVNDHSDTSLEAAYYADPDYRTPLRSAEQVAELRADLAAPYVNPRATGFRLPTSAEWELAARYAGRERRPGQLEDPGQGPYFWNPGNWISGAVSETTTRADASFYAVFDTPSTEQVATKLPNALGVYDMSGNVAEFCYDWYPGFEGDRRIRRGGSFQDRLDQLTIGRYSSASPDGGYLPMNGVRLVQSVPE